MAARRRAARSHSGGGHCSPQKNKGKEMKTAITEDESMGMTWWNTLTKPERIEVLKQAQEHITNPSAADAWRLWKSGTISTIGADAIGQMCVGCAKHWDNFKEFERDFPA